MPSGAADRDGGDRFRSPCCKLIPTIHVLNIDGPSKFSVDSGNERGEVRAQNGPISKAAAVVFFDKTS